MSYRNLVGERYGRLVVIDRSMNAGQAIRRRAVWRCVCDCGKEVIVRGDNLRHNHTQSCGCLHKERVSIAKTTHGALKGGMVFALYNTWRNMRNRCYNSRTPQYKWWGGRGIEVYWFWKEDYCIFRDWAIGAGYSVGKELHRLDNDGNYEPTNCRWVDKSEHLAIHHQLRGGE